MFVRLHNKAMLAGIAALVGLRPWPMCRIPSTERNNQMQRFHVIMRDELGDEYSVTVELPDLVDNVTEWIREEYPESDIILIRPI